MRRWHLPLLLSRLPPARAWLVAAETEGHWVYLKCFLYSVCDTKKYPLGECRGDLEIFYMKQRTTAVVRKRGNNLFQSEGKTNCKKGEWGSQAVWSQGASPHRIRPLQTGGLIKLLPPASGGCLPALCD